MTRATKPAAKARKAATKKAVSKKTVGRRAPSVIRDGDEAAENDAARNEKLDAIYGAEDERDGQTPVVIKADLHETITHWGAKRTSRKLKYRKGQVVSKAEAKAAGAKFQEQAPTATSETK